MLTCYVGGSLKFRAGDPPVWLDAFCINKGVCKQVSCALQPLLAKRTDHKLALRNIYLCTISINVSDASTQFTYSFSLLQFHTTAPGARCWLLGGMSSAVAPQCSGLAQPYGCFQCQGVPADTYRVLVIQDALEQLLLLQEHESNVRL